MTTRLWMTPRRPDWTWREVNRYGEGLATFATPARYIGVCPDGVTHETTDRDWCERVHTPHVGRK